jgi:enamine deaminase RidA (YjgF/YER057c/UK114 family)
MVARLAVCIAIGCLLLAGLAFAAKKKKAKKEPPEITQVLELPKDPPQAIVASADRLVFHVSPLSNKGLLSQQIRDAIKSIWNSSKGAQIVKIRAFVAGSGDMRRVPMMVSDMFTDRKMALPAVSVIQVGSLPLDGAQVVLESTAVDKKVANPNGVTFLSGFKPGVSGVEPRAITCFMNSLDKAGDLRTQFLTAYPRVAANFVQLRRDTLGDAYECEAIAAAAQPGKGVTGRLVISGTQLAFGSTEEDSRLAFQRLDKALTPLGASIADTVWAQFYPLSSKAVGSIRKVEFEFFDKKRAAINKPLVFEGLPSMDAQFGLEVVAALN